MAFDDFDEYEQSEQVRKWLRENGLSIVIGVVLALALIFGWRQWQAHRAIHGAQAAERYAALQTALASGQSAQVDSAAATLEKDYADSPYAALGAAARADLAVGQGRLDEAHAAMQWAVDHEKTAALLSLYILRLARVELAQDKAKQALAHLDSMPARDYRAMAQELRGDALLKLGHATDARNAYAAALTALSKDAAPGQRQLLQMKLDDLALHIAQPPLAQPLAQPGKQGT
ncbi:MAG: tetratricopeptide repeat protein [Rhodanobacteraceae bacterium]|nr:tetratricopeptide repeat protein [Pseudomonadota bacterium]